MGRWTINSVQNTYSVYEKYHVEEREETWVAEAILHRMLGKYGWKCGICEKELTGNETAKYEKFSPGRESSKQRKLQVWRLYGERTEQSGV